MPPPRQWEKDTHNRYDILFPVDDRSDRDHRGLIYDIQTTVKHGDYELIEYINDVNREYTEVLVENSFGGRMDTSYIYGVEHLSFDYENGCSGYYLYDPRGSVTGITNEQGRLVQSYRYDAFGNLTFGEPRYENEYTYNGESYNPNIESQYLRARYYDVVNGNFLTEDSYLGNINEPLTLNRYNYCVGSPVNYTDPSGNYTLKEGKAAHRALQNFFTAKYNYVGSPYKAMVEYPIWGYPYSTTGLGYADMVLTRNNIYEVYEIKPISQAFGKEESFRGVSGRRQRLGYVEALTNRGEIVNEPPTTFNPNMLILPIEDEKYQYATYYVFEQQPGMIYYRLSKQPQPRVSEVTVKAEEKKRVELCKKEVRVVDVLQTAIEISVLAEIVGGVMEKMLNRSLSGFFPFFLPIDIPMQYLNTEDIPDVYA